MKKYKNKILTLGFIGILILGFGVWDKVEAADPSIYISPAQADKEIGDIFDVTVRVNPSGQKVCVVEGKINLTKLSCQKVTMGSGISVQISPSCDNLNFLLGIQGCTTDKKTLFTVSVKAKNAGSGEAKFTGVDIIGEGVSISSTSLGGSYTITSSCSCGPWGYWQDGSCGGGSCSSTQRLQTRTRLCTPSGCETKDEYRCKDDPGCISRPPAVETEEEKIEVKEEVKGEVTEQPTQEEAGEPQKEEMNTPREVTIPEVKIPQESLLASLAMVWKEITGSTLLIIITILCLVGLVVIGVKKWWAFRKSKEK